MSKRIRALGLLSGGLDSRLAAAVLLAQGIEVTGICFTTPFFGAARAREAAAQLNLPLLEVDLTPRYYPLIYNPPHGFGRGHNACIDCHLLMIREAGAVMQSQGYHLLFTGEVLGQRPMSQNRNSLNLIARQSGFAPRLLRPLSARLLDPTEPELLGWVDRGRLLDFSGRGRRPQMALAEELGITDYPAPAGGCLLTDPGYAARLKELLRHQAQVEVRELELLKWGRQFRLPGGAKAVVGRTQRENEALEKLLGPGEMFLRIHDYPGPLVLITAAAAPEDLQQAAGLAAAYSDAPTSAPVTVSDLDRNLVFRFNNPPKALFKDWLI